MKCCFTGHRPKGFPWEYGNMDCERQVRYLAMLRDKIVEMIERGYGYFICGGALGADLDFAETVLDLRENFYPEIKLEIAVPCLSQSYKWSAADKQRYNDILSAADEVKVLSNEYTAGCMQIRNRYMVDNSSAVIAVWNGEKHGGTFSTLTYATRKGKQLILIRLGEDI